MVSFNTVIQKFGQQGDKTGWTYIAVPAKIADKLKPGNKKSFRVKGKLDEHVFSGIALIPMGGGDFIMALNASVRKAIKKMKGAPLSVSLEVDDKPITVPEDLQLCLEDEPAAWEFFNTLAKGHRNYFINWLESAKTETTRTKRIAMMINALSKKWGYPEMIRAAKKS